jgi:glutamate/tyrosine decarboxylase-like PLP-dependent enzyme
MHLSRLLVEKMKRYPAIVPFMNNLSITSFSYIPENIQGIEEKHQDYLNDLNKKILQEVQNSGKAFISNALVGGRYLLRACLVNFRTREKDLDILLELVSEYGAAMEENLQS